MPKISLAAAVAASGFLATVASSAPVTQANCALFSAAGLQGQVVELSVGTGKQSATETLAVAPASVFVADGYALKLFNAPHFKGDGTLVHSRVAYASPEQKVEGGLAYPISFYGDFGAVMSAACVPDGQLFPQNPASLYAGSAVQYYYDQAFTISGYRSNGTGASVTFKDGKKQIAFFSGGSSRYGRQLPEIDSIDLDSGDITHQPYVMSDTAQPQTVTFKAPKPGDTTSLEYAGAAAALAQELEGIASNQGNWPPQSWASVPYTELQEAIRFLRSLAKF